MTPRIRPFGLTIALAASALTSAYAHEAHQDPSLRAAAPHRPEIVSPVAVPLDPATLGTLPRQAVTTRVHEATLHCEGVPLVLLLRAAGAIPEGRLGSPHLARYVLAEGRDGYRVLFSLAELDPETGGRAAFVVDRCDGGSLDEAAGPLRLLVPGDVRAARSVRQLDSVTVVVAP